MVFLQFIGGIITSFVLIIGALLLMMIGGSIFSEDSFEVIAYIGWIQFLYLIPLAWMFNKQKQPGIAAGVLVGGGLLFLLASACFGYMGGGL